MALAFLSSLPSQGLNIPHAEPSTIVIDVPAVASPASASSNAALVSVSAVAAAGVVARRAIAGSRSKKSSSKRQHVAVAAFENELGVQSPVGFWDPAGWTEDGSIENYKRRRQTEIKHGRIAMLATMGYITPELYGKFPGFLSPSLGIKFADVPNGLGAISKVPAAGWGQIIAYMAFCEVSSKQGPGTPGAAGDFGWKVLTSSNPAVVKSKLNSELANGRLAMIAIIGMFFQEGITGDIWGGLAKTAKIFAFENERGVQEPIGFWDPLALSSSGDVSTFKRRRTVELKHGRICMLATMGYITPEVTGKFPGYLSYSANLKFADVPNGLAAISKVPALGWAQIIAYANVCELSAGSDDWKTGTPGDYGFKVLTSSDPAEKEKKLCAELANGRLAMMATIGMFFQDGLTGSAWGDWALYTDSPLRSLKSDPGFNTLPEWDRPKNGFEGLVGDQPPLGLWDPLGFTKDRDVEKFKRRREIELKHGRVAMFATMGYIAPEYYKFPGFLSTSAGLKFVDVPNGLKALSVMPTAGIAQFFAFIGFIELSYNKSYGEPGNYGKGLFGLGSLGLSATVSDPKSRDKKLRAEISNGRLAMMAIIGMVFQDGLTGSAWGDWALYTASPLRAFENELGIQKPTGFWDPLGFAKDGDAANFKRRRVTEIKHGRVAMLAAMGYITPEFFKFPGYLSVSENIKFADVPNGLAAISKVPGAGWLQIVAYGLYCEGTGGFGYNSDGQMSDPGNCGWKPPLLATNNPEIKKKRLNAELANGRLAMMAIIGMFFQDGLTGSAWGDWALYTASPMRAFENELGAQAPLGFFDPLGFSSDGDAYSFLRRRSVEIKHGRICMLATMGYITPELTGKFPGFLSPGSGLKFADVPNGLAAIGKVPAAGWFQIFSWMAFAEVGARYDADVNEKKDPGNMGWRPPLLATDNPEIKKRRLASELANGRLAMMAIIGMFFQDGLTGSAWGDWANYTDSPLRAFENELGVQAPLGFFDPIGYSKDGSAANFNRRRQSEIKHGRIAMMAAMGYITPEVAGKLPGYCSFSMNLKFADIPNGLAAISKVPSAGWAQILAYMAWCEISQDQSAGSPGAKGDFGFKVLTAKDQAGLTKKLNSELANGRLAMMAIMGMFFQDGLTGSAWGDWALYTVSPLR